MKTKLLAALFALALFAPALRAQDNAPTSIDGRAAVVVVSSGTGSVGTTGGYEIIFANAGSLFRGTYQTKPITPNLVIAIGTSFTWTKSDAFRGTLTLTNSDTRFPVEQYSITFSSPAGGTYSMANGKGTQTGAFIWEQPPAAALSSKLINVSTSGTVQPGAPLIAGFVIAGGGPKSVLIRGAGPSLAQFGVGGILTNPKLTLFNGAGLIIATNDDWGANGATVLANAMATTGAFAFTSTSSKDSALLVTLPSGNYTAQLDSSDGGSGVALVEVYEVP
jgi:hypothetical protein